MCPCFNLHRSFTQTSAYMVATFHMAPSPETIITGRSLGKNATKITQMFLTLKQPVLVVTFSNLFPCKLAWRMEHFLMLKFKLALWQISIANEKFPHVQEEITSITMCFQLATSIGLLSLCYCETIRESCASEQNQRRNR